MIYVHPRFEDYKEKRITLDAHIESVPHKNDTEYQEYLNLNRRIFFK